MEAALANPDASDLPEKVKLILRLLKKVTKEHGALTADDFRPLITAGISKTAIAEALMVAHCFNVITRMADAFEWDIPSKAGFDKSAKMLLTRGYKL